MVQTGATSGPLVRLISSKVELYEHAEDLFSWRLVKMYEAPTDRPAIGAWKAAMAAA